MMDKLPVDSTGTCPIEIGLICYDTQIYYFTLTTLIPTVYTLSSGQDTYLPTTAGLLATASSAKLGIKRVLEKLSVLFPHRRSSSSLGLALSAGYTFIKESQRIGNIIIIIIAYIAYIL